MEHTEVVEKLNDSLKDIFAFSISRIYNSQDAEDLTNDIVAEVLSSAYRLENDKAFYSFLWAVAENTLKRYIRKKKINTQQIHTDFFGVYWDTPEEKLIEKEELMLLRRELSLLSRQYRDVTVKYYIEGKPCTTISRECNISEEMVKYYLYKTRKMLKEGVKMERKYGEKSYNPGIFRVDFWGDGSNGHIWQTFERRLPGNIVLAAYKNPMSIEELSLELGVSAPYLEDELDILQQYGFVRKTGNKYQTDFLIFTTEYEKEYRKVVPATDICIEAVRCITELTESLLPKFRKIDFGIQLNDNELRWLIVNFTLLDALGQLEDKLKIKFGPYPKLKNNNIGYVFGHDNDYAYTHFSGIYGECANKAQTAWYSAVNYNVIRKCQLWQGSSYLRTELICDGILEMSLENQDKETLAQLVREGKLRVENGTLKANFPTLTTRQRHWMRQNLQQGIDAVMECMDKLCTMASAICKKYTPKHLQDRCERLSFVHRQADVMGIVAEKLVENGYLTVPDKPTNLCVFGVKRLSTTIRD